MVLELLGYMEYWGLVTMLGLRTTTGSMNVIWPTKSKLQESFMELNNKNQGQQQRSYLTVGARALQKHAHRSSEGFWGDGQGTETKWNDDAKRIINKIIEECEWINVHTLPHSEYVVEIRIRQGYGIRWTSGGVFWGFLEP